VLWRVTQEQRKAQTGSNRVDAFLNEVEYGLQRDADDPDANTLAGAFVHRLAVVLGLPLHTSGTLMVLRTNDGSVDHITTDSSVGLCDTRLSGGKIVGDYFDWNINESEHFCEECMSLANDPQTFSNRISAVCEPNSHTEIRFIVTQLTGRFDAGENWPRFSDLRRVAADKMAVLAGQEVVDRMKRCRTSPEVLLERAFGLQCDPIDLEDVMSEAKMHSAFSHIHEGFDAVIDALKVFETGS
jgi:hypothetical protein